MMFLAMQELVVNADQSGVMYMPTNRRGRAPKGSRVVHNPGGDDKRQVSLGVPGSGGVKMCNVRCMAQVYDARPKCTMHGSSV